MTREPRNEDEWFTRHEEELLRQARRERERRQQEERDQAEQERRRSRREAHWMKCPKCGDDLNELDVSGVKVDRCAGCEGIFLDRGELDMLALDRQDARRGVFRRLLGLGSG